LSGTTPADRIVGVAAHGEAISWSGVKALMTRPQPVTIPMVLLFALIPCYILVGMAVHGRPATVPAIWIDRALPLRPEWSLVYLSLFLAALLPVFVIHQQEHVHRTILAFLAAWLIGLACFLLFPTVSSRPKPPLGEGFNDWLLRAIYSSDVKYNCLPSLHVAQVYIAALSCNIVHRGVGRAALVWATLVAVSTLFTKQHYVLDVITGFLLGAGCYWAFLRDFRREAIPPLDRRYAPVMALGAVGMFGAMVLLLLALYAAGIEPYA
jgi:membrane-associated phospholipid phosphatase